VQIWICAAQLSTIITIYLFFVHTYRDYNKQAASFKEKALYSCKAWAISCRHPRGWQHEEYSLEHMMKALKYDNHTETGLDHNCLGDERLLPGSAIALCTFALLS